MHAQADANNLPPAPRLVRSVGTLRAAIGSSLLTALWILFTVVLSKHHVLGALFVPLFLTMTSRAWLAGIRIERGGVKVVGVMLSRQLPWESIDHFSVGPLGGYQYVGHVILRDGRDIGCLGIAAATRPNGERRRLEVQRPIDELNAALTAWRKSVEQPVEA